MAFLRPITDISAIHGPITDISKIFKSRFLLHYKKYNVSMPYLFFKNLKNQGLWDKFFHLQKFQYFAMIFN